VNTLSRNSAFSRREFFGNAFGFSAGLRAASALDRTASPQALGTEGGMQLYPNVFQIRSLFGDRHLFQYLFVGDRVALLDTGIAETPRKAIFPYMERLGISRARLTWAVTTHADGDHQGGNFAIRQTSAKTLLACGKADQAMVEDPDVLWPLRYNFLQKDYGVGIDPIPSPDAGKPCKMDLCFTGEEPLRLRSDWEIEVLHLPGHSHGHLGFLDRQHRAAFIGDAIHGRGCPKATGGMALPVTYYYVEVYLSTLTLVENLPIDVLYTGHWPVMRGGQIGDFIAESRQTVATMDRVILGALTGHPEGLTLHDLILAVGEAFGSWPRNTWIFLMFAIKGHMVHLRQQGKVRLIRQSRPFRWARV
jgi:glyoxylase-like metal-dependent hydrolase (beta-lactamase superfamily II)